MKSFAWMRARPKTLASAAGVTAVAVAITTMAMVYEGLPTTEVDLHDGGVWITKNDSLMVGHFNNESRLLDGGLRTTSDSYDILQAGPTVVVVDRSASAATIIDPARVALTDSASIPGGAKVALGAKTVAILEPEKGSLWVVPASGLSGFEAKSAEPIAVLGKNADVTVGTDGSVYGVSPKNGELITVPVDPQGEPLDLAAEGVAIEENAAPTITAVGTRPVVLDKDAGVLLASGGFSTPLENAADAVLQQPSGAGESVAVATNSQLLTVPFDGGAEIVERSSGGQGVPAAPVTLKGCTYGAWSESGKFIRDCLGDASDLETDIEGLEDDAELTFRVNRDVVVLNDVVSGAAWMATESLQQVDNWNDITPPDGEAEDDERTTEETVETTLPERSEINTPPVATDDEFGVRPGRSTLLPVLDNDTDADGDVLVATVPEPQLGLGTVQTIQNGGSLQLSTEEDATGSASFTYNIDDGRGGTASATATVSVHDWETNAAPDQRRTTTLAVEEGGTVSYNVLPDWIDPDGDDIYLKAVEAAPGDEVEFTTDGQLTYRAVASLQGRKDINIVVADGLGSVETGVLRLDVRPVGSTVPKTNADHFVTRVGEAITIAPLANDTSSGREPLRLARLDEVSGATIVPDFPNKSFTFESPTAGVYYVQYLVSAGPNAVPGLVRVDVQDASETDLPPVAVRDVALVPAGGSVLVNVLGNDTEPSGGILVVQSVTVPPNSGISVSVLNHESLRITDQGALDEQVRISYRISNGSASAEGDVIVIPIAAPEKMLPPIANDDQAVVRVGDVVTIPVLRNDAHPNGDAMHVSPELVEPLVDPEAGEAFVSQDQVRFRASDTPGTVYATYEVVDSMGQKDAGYITIQVLPVDLENNAAPRPRDITVRALSGSSVRIAVPLDGIDADGDSVELIGHDSAPRKGKVEMGGTNFLVYQAFEGSSGVDSFTYRVRDRLGQEATGTIRVGIAPGDEANQAPYAVKDSITVRPGRTVAVAVLANDSDPEGETPALVKKGLEVPDVDGLSAKVSGDRVLVTVPDREIETSLQYTISDSKGARATAVLQITVDEEVPLLAPIARDDRIALEDITEEMTVAVDVLTNDEDPDGTVDDLALDVDSAATILDDRTIEVTVGPERQLLRYTITDRDDQATSAFIFVPAISELAPTLASTKPLEVKSGETVKIPLADYVNGFDGGAVILTEAAKVSAINSNGADLIQDERTLVYTSRDRYFGEDALTFEVTDGTGPDDPEGRKATLTLPITVLPPDNQPPVFTNGAMSVAPGEDAVTLDLAPMTEDPDPEDKGKHRFSLTGSMPAGFKARLEGSVLHVEASSSTPKGSAATVNLTVTDGETAPVTGSVAVTVTASTRPLATANTDTVAEADQGKQIPVDVLKNDVNPFPETPLKIRSAVVETGEGEVKVDGDRLLVTPGATFFGAMTVSYRIQDATKDPDREVDGQVKLTVQGIPDAPGTPTVASVQDRTVVLSWSPPANNGAPITEYTVTSVTSPYTKKCTSTTCTLNGLTNNVEYAFTVVATNKVGDSPASPASAVARPDARPDTPVPPTLIFGDRSLKVAWTTPTTPGSPVESYTLQISPAPPSGSAEKVGVTGNSLTWEGLENGADYQVRVRAHNRAPEPSAWSAWSAGEIPAGPPGATSAPSASTAPSVGSQAQMNVSWAAAPQNGDAIAEYQLRVMRGGEPVTTISTGTARSQTVTVATHTTEYTFLVRARNKAGWGEWSAASAPLRAFGSPGAPTITGTTENNGYVTVSYSLSNTNGASASEIRYEYSVNGGAFSRNWDGTRINAGNGTSNVIRVRAYSVVGGQESQPGPSSSGTKELIPYGPVNTPGASARNNGTSVTLGWSAPADNGRGIQVMQISVNGGGWQNVGRDGTTTAGNGYQQTHSIRVRAMDTEGQWSSEASASARTNDPPVPRAWTSKGSFVSGCSGSGCYKLVINTNDAFQGGSYNIECMNNGAVFGTNAGYKVSIPSNGRVELNCYNGYAGNKSVRIIGGNPSVTEPVYW